MSVFLSVCLSERVHHVPVKPENSWLQSSNFPQTTTSLRGIPEINNKLLKDKRG